MNLVSKKVSWDADIPTRKIKQNTDLFAHFVSKDSSDMLTKGEFPQSVKNVYIKRTRETIKLIIDP